MNTFAGTLPKQYQQLGRLNIKHVDPDDHAQLLDYSISGLQIKPIDRNRHNPDSQAIVVREIIKIYGTEWGDSDQLADYCSLLYTIDNHDHFAVMNYWCVFAIAFDDHLDGISDVKEIHKWQRKYSTGRSDDNTPMDRVLVTAIDRLGRCLSVDQMRRHKRYAMGWIGSYGTAITYKRQLNEHGELISYEEFMDMKQVDCFPNMLLILSELSACFDPNKYSGLSSSELLELFAITCAKHFMLVKELYSFRKEVRAGSARYTYMYLIMCREGLTAQGAADRIVMELRDILTMANDYGNRLGELANPWLDRYVSEALHSVMGYLYWASICPKYNDS